MTRTCVISEPVKQEEAEETRMYSEPQLENVPEVKSFDGWVNDLVSNVLEDAVVDIYIHIVVYKVYKIQRPHFSEEELNKQDAETEPELEKDEETSEEPSYEKIPADTKTSERPIEGQPLKTDMSLEDIRRSSDAAARWIDRMIRRNEAFTMPERPPKQITSSKIKSVTSEEVTQSYECHVSKNDDVTTTRYVMRTTRTVIHRSTTTVLRRFTRDGAEELSFPDFVYEDEMIPEPSEYHEQRLEETPSPDLDGPMPESQSPPGFEEGRKPSYMNLTDIQWSANAAAKWVYKVLLRREKLEGAYLNEDENDNETEETTESKPLQLLASLDDDSDQPDYAMLGLYGLPGSPNDGKNIRRMSIQRSEVVEPQLDAVRDGNSRYFYRFNIDELFGADEEARSSFDIFQCSGLATPDERDERKTKLGGIPGDRNTSAQNKTFDRWVNILTLRIMETSLTAFYFYSTTELRRLPPSSYTSETNFLPFLSNDTNLPENYPETTSTNKMQSTEFGFEVKPGDESDSALLSKLGLPRISESPEKSEKHTIEWVLRKDLPSDKDSFSDQVVAEDDVGAPNGVFGARLESAPLILDIQSQPDDDKPESETLDFTNSDPEMTDKHHVEKIPEDPDKPISASGTKFTLTDVQLSSSAAAKWISRLFEEDQPPEDEHDHRPSSDDPDCGKGHPETEQQSVANNQPQVYAYEIPGLQSDLNIDTIFAYVLDVPFSQSVVENSDASIDIDQEIILKEQFETVFDYFPKIEQETENLDEENQDAKRWFTTKNDFDLDYDVIEIFVRRPTNQIFPEVTQPLSNVGDEQETDTKVPQNVNEIIELRFGQNLPDEESQNLNDPEKTSYRSDSAFTLTDIQLSSKAAAQWISQLFQDDTPTEAKTDFSGRPQDDPKPGQSSACQVTPAESDNAMSLYPKVQVFAYEIRGLEVTLTIETIFIYVLNVPFNRSVVEESETIIDIDEKIVLKEDFGKILEKFPSVNKKLTAEMVANGEGPESAEVEFDLDYEVIEIFVRRPKKRNSTPGEEISETDENLEEFVNEIIEIRIINEEKDNELLRKGNQILDPNVSLPASGTRGFIDDKPMNRLDDPEERINYQLVDDAESGFEEGINYEIMVNLEPCETFYPKKECTSSEDLIQPLKTKTDDIAEKSGNDSISFQPIRRDLLQIGKLAYPHGNHDEATRVPERKAKTATALGEQPEKMEITEPFGLEGDEPDDQDDPKENEKDESSVLDKLCDEVPQVNDESTAGDDQINNGTIEATKNKFEGFVLDQPCHEDSDKNEDIDLEENIEKVKDGAQHGDDTREKTSDEPLVLYPEDDVISESNKGDEPPLFSVPDVDIKLGPTETPGTLDNVGEQAKHPENVEATEEPPIDTEDPGSTVYTLKTYERVATAAASWLDKILDRDEEPQSAELGKPTDETQMPVPFGPEGDVLADQDDPKENEKDESSVLDRPCDEVPQVHDESTVGEDQTNDDAVEATKNKFEGFVLDQPCDEDSDKNEDNDPEENIEKVKDGARHGYDNKEKISDEPLVLYPEDDVISEPNKGNEQPLFSVPDVDIKLGPAETPETLDNVGEQTKHPENVEVTEEPPIDTEDPGSTVYTLKTYERVATAAASWLDKILDRDEEPQSAELGKPTDETQMPVPFGPEGDVLADQDDPKENEKDESSVLDRPCHEVPQVHDESTVGEDQTNDDAVEATKNKFECFVLDQPCDEDSDKNEDNDPEENIEKVKDGARHGYDNKEKISDEPLVLYPEDDVISEPNKGNEQPLFSVPDVDIKLGPAETPETLDNVGEQTKHPENVEATEEPPIDTEDPGSTVYTLKTYERVATAAATWLDKMLDRDEEPQSADFCKPTDETQMPVQFGLEGDLLADQDDPKENEKDESSVLDRPCDEVPQVNDESTAGEDQTNDDAVEATKNKFEGFVLDQPCDEDSDKNEDIDLEENIEKVKDAARHGDDTREKTSDEPLVLYPEDDVITEPNKGDEPPLFSVPDVDIKLGPAETLETLDNVGEQAKHSENVEATEEPPIDTEDPGGTIYTLKTYERVATAAATWLDKMLDRDEEPQSAEIVKPTDETQMPVPFGLEGDVLADQDDPKENEKDENSVLDRPCDEVPQVNDESTVGEDQTNDDAVEATKNKFEGFVLDQPCDEDTDKNEHIDPKENIEKVKDAARHGDDTREKTCDEPLVLYPEDDVISEPNKGDEMPLFSVLDVDIKLGPAETPETLDNVGEQTKHSELFEATEEPPIDTEDPGSTVYTLKTYERVATAAATWLDKMLDRDEEPQSAELGKPTDETQMPVPFGLEGDVLADQDDPKENEKDENSVLDRPCDEVPQVNDESTVGEDQTNDDAVEATKNKFEGFVLDQPCDEDTDKNEHIDPKENIGKVRDGSRQGDDTGEKTCDEPLVLYPEDDVISEPNKGDEMPLFSVLDVDIKLGPAETPETLDNLGEQTKHSELFEATEEPPIDTEDPGSTVYTLKTYERVATAAATWLDKMLDRDEEPQSAELVKPTDETQMPVPFGLEGEVLADQDDPKENEKDESSVLNRSGDEVPQVNDESTAGEDQTNDDAVEATQNMFEGFVLDQPCDEDSDKNQDIDPEENIEKVKDGSRQGDDTGEKTCDEPLVLYSEDDVITGPNKRDEPPLFFVPDVDIKLGPAETPETLDNVGEQTKHPENFEATEEPPIDTGDPGTTVYTLKTYERVATAAATWLDKMLHRDEEPQSAELGKPTDETQMPVPLGLEGDVLADQDDPKENEKDESSVLDRPCDEVPQVNDESTAGEDQTNDDAVEATKNKFEGFVLDQPCDEDSDKNEDIDPEENIEKVKDGARHGDDTREKTSDEPLVLYPADDVISESNKGDEPPLISVPDFDIKLGPTETPETLDNVGEQAKHPENVEATEEPPIDTEDPGSTVYTLKTYERVATAAATWLDKMLDRDEEPQSAELGKPTDETQMPVPLGLEGDVLADQDDPKENEKDESSVLDRPCDEVPQVNDESTAGEDQTNDDAVEATKNKFEGFVLDQPCDEDSDKNEDIDPEENIEKVKDGSRQGDDTGEKTCDEPLVLYPEDDVITEPNKGDEPSLFSLHDDDDFRIGVTNEPSSESLKIDDEMQELVPSFGDIRQFWENFAGNVVTEDLPVSKSAPKMKVKKSFKMEPIENIESVKDDARHVDDTEEKPSDEPFERHEEDDLIPDPIEGEEHDLCSLPVYRHELGPAETSEGFDSAGEPSGPYPEQIVNDHHETEESQEPDHKETKNQPLFNFKETERAANAAAKWLDKVLSSKKDPVDPEEPLASGSDSKTPAPQVEANLPSNSDLSLEDTQRVASAAAKWLDKILSSKNEASTSDDSRSEPRDVLESSSADVDKTSLEDTTPWFIFEATQSDGSDNDETNINANFKLPKAEDLLESIGVMSDELLDDEPIADMEVKDLPNLELSPQTQYADDNSTVVDEAPQTGSEGGKTGENQPDENDVITYELIQDTESGFEDGINYEMMVTFDPRKTFFDKKECQPTTENIEVIYPDRRFGKGELEPFDFFSLLPKVAEHTNQQQRTDTESFVPAEKYDTADNENVECSVLDRPCDEDPQATDESAVGEDKTNEDVNEATKNKFEGFVLDQPCDEDSDKNEDVDPIENVKKVKDGARHDDDTGEKPSVEPLVTYPEDDVIPEPNEGDEPPLFSVPDVDIKLDPAETLDDGGEQAKQPESVEATEEAPIDTEDPGSAVYTLKTYERVATAAANWLDKMLDKDEEPQSTEFGKPAEEPKMPVPFGIEGEQDDTAENENVECSVLDRPCDEDPQVTDESAVGEGKTNEDVNEATKNKFEGFVLDQPCDEDSDKNEDVDLTEYVEKVKDGARHDDDTGEKPSDEPLVTYPEDDVILEPNEGDEPPLFSVPDIDIKLDPAEALDDVGEQAKQPESVENTEVSPIDTEDPGSAVYTLKTYERVATAAANWLDKMLDKDEEPQSTEFGKPAEEPKMPVPFGIEGEQDDTAENENVECSVLDRPCDEDPQATDESAVGEDKTNEDVNEATKNKFEGFVLDQPCDEDSDKNEDVDPIENVKKVKDGAQHDDDTGEKPSVEPLVTYPEDDVIPEPNEGDEPPLFSVPDVDIKLDPAETLDDGGEQAKQPESVEATEEAPIDTEDPGSAVYTLKTYERVATAAANWLDKMLDKDEEPQSTEFDKPAEEPKTQWPFGKDGEQDDTAENENVESSVLDRPCDEDPQATEESAVGEDKTNEDVNEATNNKFEGFVLDQPCDEDSDKNEDVDPTENVEKVKDSARHDDDTGEKPSDEPLVTYPEDNVIPEPNEGDELPLFSVPDVDIKLDPAETLDDGGEQAKQPESVEATEEAPIDTEDPGSAVYTLKTYERVATAAANWLDRMLDKDEEPQSTEFGKPAEEPKMPVLFGIEGDVPAEQNDTAENEKDENSDREKKSKSDGGSDTLSPGKDSDDETKGLIRDHPREEDSEKSDKLDVDEETKADSKLQGDEAIGFLLDQPCDESSDGEDKSTSDGDSDNLSSEKASDDEAKGLILDKPREEDSEKSDKSDVYEDTKAESKLQGDDAIGFVLDQPCDESSDGEDKSKSDGDSDKLSPEVDYDDETKGLILDKPREEDSEKSDKSDVDEDTKAESKLQGDDEIGFVQDQPCDESSDGEDKSKSDGDSDKLSPEVNYDDETKGLILDKPREEDSEKSDKSDVDEDTKAESKLQGDDAIGFVQDQPCDESSDGEDKSKSVGDSDKFSPEKAPDEGAKGLILDHLCEEDSEKSNKSDVDEETRAESKVQGDDAIGFVQDQPCDESSDGEDKSKSDGDSDKLSPEVDYDDEAKGLILDQPREEDSEKSDKSDVDEDTRAESKLQGDDAIGFVQDQPCDESSDGEDKSKPDCDSDKLSPEKAPYEEAKGLILDNPCEEDSEKSDKSDVDEETNAESKVQGDDAIGFVQEQPCVESSDGEDKSKSDGDSDKLSPEVDYDDEAKGLIPDKPREEDSEKSDKSDVDEDTKAESKLQGDDAIGFVQEQPCDESSDGEDKSKSDGHFDKLSPEKASDEKAKGLILDKPREEDSEKSDKSDVNEDTKAESKVQGDDAIGFVQDQPCDESSDGKDKSKSDGDSDKLSAEVDYDDETKGLMLDKPHEEDYEKSDKSDVDEDRKAESKPQGDDAIGFVQDQPCDERSDGEDKSKSDGDSDKLSPEVDYDEAKGSILDKPREEDSEKSDKSDVDKETNAESKVQTDDAIGFVQEQPCDECSDGEDKSKSDGDFDKLSPEVDYDDEAKGLILDKPREEDSEKSDKSDVDEDTKAESKPQGDDAIGFVQDQPCDERSDGEDKSKSDGDSDKLSSEVDYDDETKGLILDKPREEDSEKSDKSDVDEDRKAESKPQGDDAIGFVQDQPCDESSNGEDKSKSDGDSDKLSPEVDYADEGKGLILDKPREEDSEKSDKSDVYEDTKAESKVQGDDAIGFVQDQPCDESSDGEDKSKSDGDSDKLSPEVDYDVETKGLMLDKPSEEDSEKSDKSDVDEDRKAESKPQGDDAIGFVQDQPCDKRSDGEDKSKSDGDSDKLSPEVDYDVETKGLMLDKPSEEDSEKSDKSDVDEDSKAESKLQGDDAIGFAMDQPCDSNNDLEELVTVEYFDDAESGYEEGVNYKMVLSLEPWDVYYARQEREPVVEDIQIYTPREKFEVESAQSISFSSIRQDIELRENKTDQASLQETMLPSGSLEPDKPCVDLTVETMPDEDVKVPVTDTEELIVTTLVDDTESGFEDGINYDLILQLEPWDVYYAKKHHEPVASEEIQIYKPREKFEVESVQPISFLTIRQEIEDTKKKQDDEVKKQEAAENPVDDDDDHDDDVKETVLEPAPNEIPSGTPESPSNIVTYYQPLRSKDIEAAEEPKKPRPDSIWDERDEDSFRTVSEDDSVNIPLLQAQDSSFNFFNMYPKEVRTKENVTSQGTEPVDGDMSSSASSLGLDGGSDGNVSYPEPKFHSTLENALLETEGCRDSFLSDPKSEPINRIEIIEDFIPVVKHDSDIKLEILPDVPQGFFEDEKAGDYVSIPVEPEVSEKPKDRPESVVIDIVEDPKHVPSLRSDSHTWKSVGFEDRFSDPTLDEDDQSLMSQPTDTILSNSISLKPVPHRPSRTTDHVSIPMDNPADTGNPNLSGVTANNATSNSILSPSELPNSSKYHHHSTPKSKMSSSFFVTFNENDGADSDSVASSEIFGSERHDTISVSDFEVEIFCYTAVGESSMIDVNTLEVLCFLTAIKVEPTVHSIHS